MHRFYTRYFVVEMAVILLLLMAAETSVMAQNMPTASAPSYTGDVVSDFKYLANNTEADGEDILLSPLRIGQLPELLSNPKFYLVLGGSAALWGGSFALDQTMRSHLRSMSNSDANLLQNVSYGSVSASAALLYGYGLYEHKPRAREYALTAGEAAGIATLVDIGIKDAFGRLRPHQDHHSHTAFFHGGQSFVSGDVTPMFALAAGVSEYYHNRWYVSVPVYSLALLDGFGRMGHDEHWFSDVIGAALLGAGTTELFLYLHRYHAEHPSRFRIFPVATPPPSPQAGNAPSIGATIAMNF